MAVSRDEMETVLIYDNLADKWHVSTDVPKHIRKYLPLLESPKLTEENGKTVYCEGWLNGTVAVSKKRQLTEKQKQAASERLAAIREKQK